MPKAFFQPLYTLLALLAWTESGSNAADATTDEGVHETSTGLVLRPVAASAIRLTASPGRIDFPPGVPFLIAEREVSQAEFSSITGNNPSSTRAPKLPVDRVTPTEAEEFCQKLTQRDRETGILPHGKIYRLPTVNEWIRATYPRGWPPSYDRLKKTFSAGESQILPVGTTEHDPSGLHDLLGNVAEWAISTQRFTSTTTLTRANQQGLWHRRTFEESERDLALEDDTLSMNEELRKLTAHWGSISQDERFRRLRQNTSIDFYFGYAVMAISYTAEDPIKATDVASAIASAYAQRVGENEELKANAVLESLKEPLRAQMDHLDKSRIVMLDLMEEFNIVDFAIGRPSWVQGLQTPELGAIPPPNLKQKAGEEKYLAAKQDYQIQKEKLNQLQQWHLLPVRDEVDRGPRTRRLSSSTIPTPFDPKTIQRAVGVGGSAFSRLQRFPKFIFPKSSTERIKGLGFRIVMADK